MKIRQEYVCKDCGQPFDELGDGKCYVCGGSIIPIDVVGEEDPEYPEELMEEAEEENPEDYLDEESEEF